MSRKRAGTIGCYNATAALHQGAADVSVLKIRREHLHDGIFDDEGRDNSSTCSQHSRNCHLNNYNIDLS